MKKLLLIVLLIILWSTVLASTNKYRLTLRSDPATSIVIGWNQLDGEGVTVYFGKEDHGQDWQAYAHSLDSFRIVSFAGMNNHFARLTNLEPNTAYYFVIKDSNSMSPRLWFKTTPDNPQERLSFVAGGDSRNNRGPRQNGNMLVSKLKPHAVLFGGDMTRNCTSEEWNVWFDDWQLTISEDGRMYPIVATRGNHETNDDYIYNLFDTPKNNEGVYYSLTFGGSLFQVFTLNTEIVIGGDQTAWLSDQLQKGDVRWKAAQYHKPMRPHLKDKSEGNEQYDNWAKEFYENGVKLVVECDAHMVKTTWPIVPSTDEGSEEGFIRDDVKGTVYTGEGCWGAPLRPNNDNKSWTRNSGRFNQFKWLFVDQGKIEMRTIQFDNAPFLKENANDEPFFIPEELKIWSPSNGEVVTIYHDDVTPPTVQLTAPMNGTVVQEGKEITISALANDTDGDISSVQFFVNDQLLVEDFEAPYDVEYLASSKGEKRIYVVATDNDNNTRASSELHVSVGLYEFLDPCEELTGWKADETLSLSSDRVQGEGSIEFQGSGAVEFSKSFEQTYHSEASPAFARLEFSYYVSDASKLDGENQVELGSGGTSDRDEYNWSLGSLNDGWNLIRLDISEASKSGSPDLSAINWFRIYNFKSGEVTSRIDGLRITDPSKAFKVRDFTDLDQGSLFHFSLMSDNTGASPYEASSLKREVSMQRLGAWVTSSQFIIGAGDHLVGTAEDDPFLTYIKNDPYWRVKFYPNIADGENQAFGSNSDDWGLGWELFNYVDNFWDRPNVEMQPNKVDYYAHFEHKGFKVHLIQLHFPDSPTNAKESFKEESRQFMQDRLEQLSKIKTKKDIIIVVAHSSSGDFVRDADFNDYRKDLLLSTADICISATIQTFERYAVYNKAYPNGAVHYNSGAACQRGSTHGYMEFHVLDDPPRVVIQYVNLEDYSSRRLQTDYIDGFGDPTLALVKEIGGPAYNVEWSKLELTKDECPDNPNKLKPGLCGCEIPEGTCAPLDLTVVGGSGDGTYDHDKPVGIVADPAPEGFEFDFWGTLVGYPNFENVNAGSTNLTLGTSQAQVKANYKPLINDAAFVEQSVPDTMRATQIYEVSITMKNTGGLPWMPGTYKLVFGAEEDREKWDVLEVELAQEVKPQDQFVFQFNTTAPDEPGVYDFKWQLQDGDGEIFGASTDKMSITILELILKATSRKINHWVIYPNPASNEIFIQSGDQSLTNLDVKLYSMTGAVVMESSLVSDGAGSFYLDLSDMKAGLYIVEVSHDGVSAVKRFMIK